MREYFVRSPFRSFTFSASAALVLVFAVWGIMETRAMPPERPCASNAILTLALLPVMALIYAVFLHREIRAIVESCNEIPPYSHLHVLHRAFVGAVLLACFIVVLALTVNCPNKIGL
jgi:hypothetical protein